MGWLYRYEVKQLHKWILSSNELRSIKGGSQLVLDLDSLLCKSLTALDPRKQQERCWEIETNVGGGATVRFSSDSVNDAQTMVTEFAAAWPMIIDRVAPGLKVAQAYVDGFDQLSSLMTELRADSQKPPSPIPELGSCVLRSPSTERPALPLHAWQPNEADPYSFRDSASAARLCRDLTKSSVSGVDAPWEKLAGDYANVDKAGSNFRKPMTDIDDMLSSYIAIVHIDVNDLGQRLQSMPSADRRAATQTLTDLLEVTAQQSFAELVRSTDVDKTVNEAHPYPLRPIIQGGDDISVLMRGDLGLQFATNYLSTLHDLSRRPRTLKILKTPVEACAGVAILHAHFPFHRGHRLAESMCKFAKDRLRNRGESGETTPSGLVFHRASDSLLGDFEEIRERELSKSQPIGNYARQIMLSGAPYTLNHISDEFHTLGELHNIKDALDHPAIPGGPVRRALGAIESPNCLSILSRLGDVLSEREDGRTAWNKFFDAMQTSHRDNYSTDDDPSAIRLFEADPFATGNATNFVRTLLFDAMQWRRAETEGRKIKVEK